MLVRNGRSVFQNPGVFSGAVYGQFGNNYAGRFRNRSVGAFPQTFSGHPNGALAPSGFILPTKSGSISSYTVSTGSITPSANLIPARNLEASANISIAVSNAQLDQIVSLLASGTLTISVDDAGLVAAASGSASSTMTITVGSSTLGAIFSVSATSACQIDESAVLTALAFMIAEAPGTETLSTETIAEAVWGTLKTNANTSGSIGEAITKIETNANLIPAAL